MTVLTDLIAQLNQSRIAEGVQPIVCDVDALIAALNSFGVAPTAAVPAPVTPTSALPPGRVTLTTGVPILSQDVNAAGTIFYTPWAGNVISLYNGTGFASGSFAEVSQLLTDTTKSPAAAVANATYDMLAWDDGGTFRCTRNGGWFTNTNRGDFGGGAELTRTVGGILTNKYDVTKGPLANRGIYVGSIRTDGAAKVNMQFAPAYAVGGNANRLDVWNMYNRKPAAAVCVDSVISYNYTVAAFRLKNASANNSITFLVGMVEDALTAINYQISSTTAGEGRSCAIGYDDVSVPDARCFIGLAGGSTNRVGKIARLVGIPAQIGYHGVYALEAGEAAGVTTWYGVTTITTNPYLSQLQLSINM